MSVVYGCGLKYKAWLWGGLPVPETSFEKLGPMQSSIRLPFVVVTSRELLL